LLLEVKLLRFGYNIFYLVHILRQFIYAERMGNWYLHLECVDKMIPFFHSTGHFQFAKSAHLYLQDMYQLEKHMHPGEFKKIFNEGYSQLKDQASFGVAHSQI